MLTTGSNYFKKTKVTILYLRPIIGTNWSILKIGKKSGINETYQYVNNIVSQQGLFKRAGNRLAI